jgi:putative tryptophan/tyrosine transport system substrate-binding protein
MRRREFITLLGGVAATAIWSRVAHAQRTGRVPTVGVLWHAASAEEEGPYFRALIEGLRALGHAEGRNIKFEHRFPNEMPERFKSMAAELVSLNVDVLASVGNVAAPYAKNATTTIPIVFMLVADPVESKLVESFARPGGNATGLSTFAADLVGRRLQVLKEMIPGLSRFAQLVNPNAPASRMNIEMTRAAAAGDEVARLAYVRFRGSADISRWDRQLSPTRMTRLRHWRPQTFAPQKHCSFLR